MSLRHYAFFRCLPLLMLTAIMLYAPLFFHSLFTITTLYAIDIDIATPYATLIITIRHYFHYDAITTAFFAIDYCYCFHYIQLR